jgi:hypothetical protein
LTVKPVIERNLWGGAKGAATLEIWRSQYSVILGKKLLQQANGSGVECRFH